jgi:hypothetical protein
MNILLGCRPPEAGSIGFVFELNQDAARQRRALITLIFSMNILLGCRPPEAGSDYPNIFNQQQLIYRH